MNLHSPDAPAPDRLTRHSLRRCRVLVDLSHAADGYVGIAQDARLVFDMLGSTEGVDVAGLLWPTGRHDLPRIRDDGRTTPASEAGVLHWMGRNWHDRSYPSFLKLPIESYEMLRSDHALRPVASPTNAVWRTLFGKTLLPSRRADVLAHGFYASDLSVRRVIDRTLRAPFLPSKRLAANGFDFVLFCMPRPVRLPQGVRQLVRFHDAVPLTDVDTQADWRSAYAHQQLTRRCSPDAVFVCNSPQSRDDLIALDPTRERHARVVPCALAPLPDLPGGVPLPAIVGARRSARTLTASARAVLPPVDPDTRYVLSVGTLEPRKNLPGLIRAWERVINRSDPDLRLVIVGNQGWQDEPVMRAMEPHLLTGRLIHLEKLPQDEMLALAAGAVCFAFPSFNEGFGYPPLEALQAGTPSVVSDIPVFRWTFGEAALYVDPYDIESLAVAIERLAVHPGHRDLRRELLRHREAVLARFSVSRIRDEWSGLLDELGSGADAVRT